jgi:hypothetical protein
MKKVAIIGNATDISGVLHPIKDSVTIVDINGQVDPFTTVTYHYCARPKFDTFYSSPKITGHKRPYKFHK